MVGQASKAADMRAGNVPKPGMKAMNGGGGSVSRSSQKYVAPAAEKPKAKPKGLTHGQMVMQWEANGRDAEGKLIKHTPKKQGWTKDEINRARDRADAERRRAAEQAAVTTTPAGAAGEAVETAEGVPAHELARARLRELAHALQTGAKGAAGGGAEGASAAEGAGASCEPPPEEQWAIAECRRSQLEELECLEAMFADEFVLVSSAGGVERLRELSESLGEDAAGTDAAALREVAAHPPLECSLQLTAHGERPAAEEGERAVPLVASILLRVRLPVEYPKTPPVLAIEDVMVTTQEPLGRDKMLTTVARLNEDALVAAMLERAAATLPEPCIYEVATCLTESALEAVGHSWV
uniref:RWD domain-containing protein n=1 Tax=Emiliania huxleyi TaxID=2903 RepID=A0A6V2Q7E0_EMIHU